MIFKSPTCVGFGAKREHQSYVGIHFLAIAYAACCFDCVFYGKSERGVEICPSVRDGLKRNKLGVRK